MLGGCLSMDRGRSSCREHWGLVVPLERSSSRVVTIFPRTIGLSAFSLAPSWRMAPTLRELFGVAQTALVEIAQETLVSYHLAQFFVMLTSILVEDDFWLMEGLKRESFY